jgi:DNA repair protein RadA/Sms
MGKCPDCGTWDALEKYVEPKSTSETQTLAAAWAGGVGEAASIGNAGESTGTAVSSTALATPLPEIETTDFARLPTSIAEFDRVLGGGLVPGSVILLGGDPGIGKSTLMLQAAGRLAQAGTRVLYVTSEESAYQTRLRAERLFEHAGVTIDRCSSQAFAGVDALGELFVLADTNLARIVEQARQVQPALCVIDSIQMIYKADLEASPGSVTQLRRCAMELVYLAKVSGMAIVLVGHVTKEGTLAGPKLLEHLVDAVLSFEGDRHHAHRVVRGIKNRFGTTLEVGLFEMTGSGLREVTEIAALLDPAARPRPGSAICPAMHGSRCLLVELQALTATGILGAAKRKVSGIDSNRLAMLIAVLEKHGGLRLADQDVFASAVGGLKVAEPAADLALCVAIAGAHLTRALPAGTAAIGEVGLGGEIRHVHQMEPRIREALRLGYRRVLVPADAPEVTLPVGAATVRVPTVSAALGELEVVAAEQRARH